MSSFRSSNASRFEVFNAKTGETVDSWPFPYPEASPRKRALAFQGAKGYALNHPGGLCVRLWEGPSPVPVVVFSPHSL
jgi:hypothetical protein